MKLTNEQINLALGAMARVCGGGNRLPTLVALRASRIRHALDAAWKLPDEHREQLCRDNGVINESGQAYDFPTREGREAFDRGWKELLAEEQEVALETLTVAEIESGWYRGESGKKESGLDLAPDTLGTLVRLGIVTEGDA